MNDRQKFVSEYLTKMAELGYDIDQITEFTKLACDVLERAPSVEAFNDSVQAHMSGSPVATLRKSAHPLADLAKWFGGSVAGPVLSSIGGGLAKGIPKATTEMITRVGVPAAAGLALAVPAAGYLAGNVAADMSDIDPSEFTEELQAREEIDEYKVHARRLRQLMRAQQQRA